ncbi:MAG: hypothetical protein IPM95_16090 [Sphingobacteriales bacterium]|jgi:hypothetical protein|nr:hypothetical protein [Sphingobacteriales bacterium]
MKTVTTTIAAILFAVMSITSASAKTTTMTKDRFDLVFKGIDNSIVGTWEKNKDAASGTASEFCQFNANGTYVSFTQANGKIMVTGRGSWMVKNGQITIVNGGEVSSVAAYSATDNQLVFGEETGYSKPTAAFASR